MAKRPALILRSDPKEFVRSFRVGEAIFLDERVDGVTIGRLRGELTIRWENMQRRMCRVYLDHECRVLIGDINDRGGVFVNDTHIPTRPRGHVHVLRDGDEIAFGSWGADPPTCTTTLRFSNLDDDPLTRIARLGPWYAIDRIGTCGPGTHRGFQPERDGMLLLVPKGTGNGTGWASIAGIASALPKIVETATVGSTSIAYHAFDWEGGLPVSRLMSYLGPGTLDPTYAAHILLEVSRAMSAAWDAGGVAFDCSDVHITWRGGVSVLPRYAARPTNQTLGGDGLAALFRELAPAEFDRVRASLFIDEHCAFSAVDSAVRDFHRRVGKLSDCAHLGEMTRAAAPREHTADLLMREQLQLVSSDSAASSFPTAEQI